MRFRAVKLRGIVFAGERHAEAVDKAIIHFAPKSRDQLRLVWAIDEGKEPIEFGACDTIDGLGYEPDAEYQEARKKMYIG